MDRTALPISPTRWQRLFWDSCAYRFSDWTSYYLFVGLSLGLLLLGARLLATVSAGAAWKAFAYFAMFCSMPVYLMLWTGQIHVLLVVAVALILAGLMRLERADPNPNRCRHWIQAGLLLSMLSKPAVVFMLPVLLVTARLAGACCCRSSSMRQFRSSS